MTTHRRFQAPIARSFIEHALDLEQAMTLIRDGQRRVAPTAGRREDVF
jgi:hypothetical protein